MDNSMNDTTQLVQSPQKQQIDLSRNSIPPTAHITTNLITPIKEERQENEPESQEPPANTSNDKAEELSNN